MIDRTRLVVLGALLGLPLGWATAQPAMFEKEQAIKELGSLVVAARREASSLRDFSEAQHEHITKRCHASDSEGEARRTIIMRLPGRAI